MLYPGINVIDMIQSLANDQMFHTQINASSNICYRHKNTDDVFFISRKTLIYQLIISTPVSHLYKDDSFSH